MTLPRPALAAIGLGARLLTRLAAEILPWSSRSQQDTWRAGYIEGLRDATRLRQRTEQQQ